MPLPPGRQLGGVTTPPSCEAARHAPPRQAGASKPHAVGLPQSPSAPQVSTSLPAHRVVMGAHGLDAVDPELDVPELAEPGLDVDPPPLTLESLLDAEGVAELAVFELLAPLLVPALPLSVPSTELLAAVDVVPSPLSRPVAEQPPFHIARLTTLPPTTSPIRPQRRQLMGAPFLPTPTSLES